LRHTQVAQVQLLRYVVWMEQHLLSPSMEIKAILPNA